MDGECLDPSGCTLHQNRENSLFGGAILSTSGCTLHQNRENSLFGGAILSTSGCTLHPYRENFLMDGESESDKLFTAHPIWRQAGSGWRVHISKAGLPLSQIGGVAFEKCDAPQKEFVRQKVIYLFRIILTAPYIPASFPRTASLKSVSRDAWNAAGL